MKHSIKTLAVLAMLGLSFAMTSGCATMRPEVNSVADAIVVTSSEIETLAQELTAMCGNVTPNAPCVRGSLISSAFRDEAKAKLGEALDGIEGANRLLMAGESVGAGNRLEIVEAIVAALRAELAQESGP